MDFIGYFQFYFERSYWMTDRKWYLSSQDGVEWKICRKSSKMVLVRNFPVCPIVLFTSLNLIFRCFLKLSWLSEVKPGFFERQFVKWSVEWFFNLTREDYFLRLFRWVRFETYFPQNGPFFFKSSLRYSVSYLNMNNWKEDISSSNNLGFDDRFFVKSLI